MTEKQKSGITIIVAVGFPLITAAITLGVYLKSVRDTEACVDRVQTQVYTHDTRITVLERTLPTMAQDVKEIKDEVRQLNRELLRRARDSQTKGE